MVTHDPNAASYADRVVFLADGQIVTELSEPTADAVLDTMKRLDTVGGGGLTCCAPRSRACCPASCGWSCPGSPSCSASCSCPARSCSPTRSAAPSTPVRQRLRQHRRIGGGEAGGRPAGTTASSRHNLPADVVATVKAVPGVATATGVAQADGARVIGKNGKVVTSFGPPQLRLELDRHVRPDPAAPGPRTDCRRRDRDQRRPGQGAGYKVGDQVGVLTLQPKRSSRWSASSATAAAGTRSAARGGRLHRAGRAGADAGRQGRVLQHRRQSRRRVRARRRCGTRCAPRSVTATWSRPASSFRRRRRRASAEGLCFFNNILLGFAGVALFVGIFLILNTFSIIVAQRTRELALMRAIGASRRQMIGVRAGRGDRDRPGRVGARPGRGHRRRRAAWRTCSASIGGCDLPLAGVGVPAAAVIGAFAVGLVITVVAALLPALRASRIPPVAAHAGRGHPGPAADQGQRRRAAGHRRGRCGHARRRAERARRRQHAVHDPRRGAGQLHRGGAADPADQPAGGVPAGPAVLLVGAGQAGPAQLRAATRAVPRSRPPR